MKVVLISTYELGRQPFGLASPAAWLRASGHDVTCADLAVGSLPVAQVRDASLIGFYLPMHTATRLAVEAMERVRRLNSSAHLCCYGLYAFGNADYLRSIGVHTVIGGEFEAALVELADGHVPAEHSLERLRFHVPDRSGLPVSARYPKLIQGEERKRVGYTEASRGCKHRCRHCPVVDVYDGQFRIVQPEIVLADVRQQVKAGAEHITFGDPDFLNGPTHARRIVEAVHDEFPNLTYDVTIKIEHLIQHRRLLPTLRETGCSFVISAVESVDDEVLEKLDKGHTQADFLEVVRLFSEHDLILNPTFIPFTPWTTRDSYCRLLDVIAEKELSQHVAPVQLSLRLLIPARSRLLELEDVRRVIGQYQPQSLTYPWRHADPGVDRLGADILSVVHAGTKARLGRGELFCQIWETAHSRRAPENFRLLPRTTIPYMEEPWFC